MQNASHRITNQRLDAVHKHIRETITGTSGKQSQAHQGNNHKHKKHRKTKEGRTGREKRRRKTEEKNEKQKIKDKKSFSTSRRQETTKSKMT